MVKKACANLVAASMWLCSILFFTSTSVGSINQNTAPSGWSYITKYDVSSLSADGGFYSSFAYIKPSGNSGGIGADAINVKFSY